MKKKKNKIEDLRQMLIKWLEIDMVKSGYYYNDIERKNEAFARGWRWGIKSVISKIEDKKN